MAKELSKLEILGIVTGSVSFACILISIILLCYFPKIRKRLIKFISSCCSSNTCCCCSCIRTGKKNAKNFPDDYDFSGRNGTGGVNAQAVPLGDVVYNPRVIFPVSSYPVKYHTADESSLYRDRRASTNNNNKNGGDTKEGDRSTATTNSDPNKNGNSKRTVNNNNNLQKHHPLSLSRRGSRTNSEDLYEELESQMVQSLNELEEIRKELVQTIELDRKSLDEKNAHNETHKGDASAHIVATNVDEVPPQGAISNGSKEDVNTAEKPSPVVIVVDTLSEVSDVPRVENCEKKVTDTHCQALAVQMRDGNIADNLVKESTDSNNAGVTEENENPGKIQNSLDLIKSRPVSQTLSPLKELTNYDRINNNKETDASLPNNNNDNDNDKENGKTLSTDVESTVPAPRSIILAVDATPKNNGAYILVEDKETCEFYSVHLALLPWRLRNMSRRGNAAEFEMKNLLFALLNWESTIIEYENMYLYTDNMGILEHGIGSRQGINVRAYLRHLQKCKNVKILNSNPHVHTYRNPGDFEKFIKPADHLSRRRFYDFKFHIEQYFPSINIFKNGFNNQKVEQRIEDFIKHRCSTCGFRIRVSGSLRDTIKKRTKVIRNAIPNSHY